MIRHGMKIFVQRFLIFRLSPLVNSPLLLVEALAWTASPEFLRRDQGSSSFSLGEQALVLVPALGQTAPDERLRQEESDPGPALRQREASSWALRVRAQSARCL